MNPDEGIVLRTYPGESLAGIAAARLRFEGIESHIQKDDCGGAYPSLQMSGGVRLIVKPEDMEDAEKILKQMEVQQSERDASNMEQEGSMTTKSSCKSFEVLPIKDLPSRQLDEIKTFIFTYVALAPLLAALFANKIDSMFVACLLFVGLVGTAFIHLKNRLEQLEKSVKDQERRLMELEDVNDEGSE